MRESTKILVIIGASSIILNGILLRKVRDRDNTLKMCAIRAGLTNRMVEALIEQIPGNSYYLPQQLAYDIKAYKIMYNNNIHG